MSELLLDVLALVGMLALVAIVVGFVTSAVLQKLDGKDD